MNNNTIFANLEIETPAFVYEEDRILSSIQRLLSQVKTSTGCKILFPLKSFSIATALQLMSHQIDGFSASSLFEAKLARDILGDEKSVHITTPGLRYDEIGEISELCDYISFNSLSQWGRCRNSISDKTSCGLRINPQLLFVKDDRYNPCRKYSKLGVPITTLSDISNNGFKDVKDIKGLHFHTNCESKDFDHLFTTVKHIDAHIPEILGQVKWLNLGGGYLFEDARDLDKLIETVIFLRKKYDAEVFFEPGKGIVGKAGYIVSSVVDMFESDGQNIAILDTTVNHMPEVFEYQHQPRISQESEKGKYEYILAGATCLAGDLFGEYTFDEPLERGSQIVFEEMGAYTMVKAHMFNGVNLPAVYAYTKDGELELKKQFSYEEYVLRCGANEYATV